MKEYIVFKRQRELGEILSDTFKFIRLEYKPLFSALIKNAGIPFLVLLAAAGFYAATATDFADITGGIFRSGNVIMGVLFLIAGFVACILPGIYLSVPLSLVFAIMIFRGRGISDSISESFVLIKGEWWVTFATIIVVSLVVYLIGMVFQVPVIIYTIIKGLTSSSEISNGDFSSMFDWVYITLNVIASAVSYILYAVVAIASAFIYYNLNETKNQTGTLERIDSIGDNI